MAATLFLEFRQTVRSPGNAGPPVEADCHAQHYPAKFHHAVSGLVRAVFGVEHVYNGLHKALRLPTAKVTKMHRPKLFTNSLAIRKLRESSTFPSF